ncbi:hypothetical protein TSOC_004476 [Tetrabaena socialis]|uniref:Right handed beta helix domain-containing protein n=1 Tax=Tetrabaena socialis TaxID=47790 RepID=A0A2J8A8X6_9CHLO|nr:hypothetical protein TSOC_004476 [Tetrabaena socialis]|eukprot:PNH08955.1 hypothetical protein TSOC_004476 [Tetrabaena socialis]
MQSAQRAPSWGVARRRFPPAAAARARRTALCCSAQSREAARAGGAAAPQPLPLGGIPGAATADGHAAAAGATACSRRQALVGALASFAAAGVSGLWFPGGSAAGEPSDDAQAAASAFCLVEAAGAGSSSLGGAPEGLRRITFISEAAAACPDGGVVLVAAGRYRERLVLSRPMTIKAWPKGALVEVVWETTEPYQSTLEIAAPPAPAGTAGGGGVVLEGLTVRHSSKSVANNYGVLVRAGSPRLVGCDISSATGAGVGVEGASPQLLGCRIHDCARQGLAIFGASSFLEEDAAADPALLYGMSGGVVQGCDVYGNALDGLLVRSGASPDILDNLVHNNGGVGVNLQDCSGRYEGNTVYENRGGAVAVSALFELDAGDLAGSNSLRGLLRRL